MATARYYQGYNDTFWDLRLSPVCLFYVSCIAGIASGVLNSHWLVAGIALYDLVTTLHHANVVINRTAKEMGGNRKYYFSLPLFDLLQPIQSLNFKICRFLRGKGDFHEKIGNC